MKNASIDWSSPEIPVSEAFGDVYFSREDAIAETRHVFLKGIGAPEIWQDSPHFVIGETGFGTGLNFLVTWKDWLDTAPSDGTLHFVSVEGFPLGRDDLEKTHQAFPEFAEMASELRAKWPPDFEGLHRLVLAGGRIQLTLVYAPVLEGLREITGTFDAWYLDGFAPRKNPDMWSVDVLTEIARLSRPGTRLGTFTAVGDVRRGLAEVGFEVRKVTGYGRKRDSTQAVFVKSAEPPDPAPWFKPPAGLGRKLKIAVIGGGIAGCMSARMLTDRGHQVTLFERNDAVGREGSGNLYGLMEPRIGLDATTDKGFHAHAFLGTVQIYKALEEQGLEVYQGRRGSFSLATSDKDWERFQAMADRPPLPKDWFKIMDAGEASAALGFDVARGGIFFPDGGCLAPAKLCQALVAGLDVRLSTDLPMPHAMGDGWMVAGETWDGVVITSANASMRLMPGFDLPLQPTRGQVSIFPANEATRKLSFPVSFGHYLSPALPGPDGDLIHVGGATHQHWGDETDRSWAEVASEDHAKNRDGLADGLPSFASVIDFTDPGGKAALRATTPDRLPILGALPVGKEFAERYARVKHGSRAGPFAPVTYQKGLYVFTGLGSRGLATAPFMASILCDLIEGVPMHASRSQIDALHPARFEYRRLKKGK